MADISRTDSTQAMKNILNAYGGDDEVADEEDEAKEDDDTNEVTEKDEKDEKSGNEETMEGDDHSDKLDYDISNSEDDEPKPTIVVTPIKRVVEDASSQDNTPKKMKTSRGL